MANGIVIVTPGGIMATGKPQVAVWRCESTDALGARDILEFGQRVAEALNGGNGLRR